MLSLGGFITHPIVLTVLAVVAIVGFAATIWAVLRSPTKADTDALSQQIKDLEGKVTLGPEYLDGLPAAVNQKLRAAYQEARILQLEGYEARSREKHEEASDRFTRALSLAENDSQRAALHNLRGLSFYSLGEYDKAEADYRKTEALANNISPPRDAAQARASALGNLGDVYSDKSDLDRSDVCHKEALEICADIGDLPGEATQLGSLGINCRLRGQLEKAEEYHKRALLLREQLGDPVGQANQLINLGGVHLERGELNKAADHFERALKIHIEAGSRRGQAQSLGNLGLVHRSRGELHKAEDYHKQALDLDRKIGNRLSEGHDLGNLGLVYRCGGDLDSAEECHKDALDIHREIGDRLAEANDLGNLGVIYNLRGDLEKAEEYHRRALHIHEQVGNPIGKASDLAELGLVYADRGEIEQAREHLKSAQAIYQEIGAGTEGPEIVRRALEHIAKAERISREAAEQGEARPSEGGRPDYDRLLGRRAGDVAETGLEESD